MEDSPEVSDVIAIQDIAGETVGLKASSGVPTVTAADGSAAITAEEEMAFHLDGGLAQVVAHLSDAGSSGTSGDGFDALRAQVPDGLNVMLDTTTMGNALNALTGFLPSPLALLDLATLSTAMVCFDNVVVQPSTVEIPASDLGVTVLEQSREVIAGPMWSICGYAGRRMDERRRDLEAAWANFLGWPESDAKLDVEVWNDHQDSPRYWDGVVAGYYMDSLFMVAPDQKSSAEFLGIQTMRTMVNYELASRLGIPYMAAAFRCPVQSLIIRENHERQIVMARLMQKLGPHAARPVGSSDEPYVLEYSAPFVLGLIMEHMQKPGDYWELVADYRSRFSPLRERLRRDRENWDGRAGPYVRQMLKHIGGSADFVEHGEQDIVDASAALVSVALGGVAGPSVTLAMKLISLLFPANKVRRCYYRWFRPELYLLTSLRNEAERLRAMDQRVKSIWKCRWDESCYRQFDMLRAANPAPFLRLGELQ
jgi:hypothetical protein